MKTHRDLDVWKEGIELATFEGVKSKLLGLIRYLKGKGDK